jgi:hypothetical protein
MVRFFERDETAKAKARAGWQEEAGAKIDR